MLRLHQWYQTGRPNKWVWGKWTVMAWYLTPQISAGVPSACPWSSLALFFSSSAFWSSLFVPSPSLYMRLALAQPHTCPSSQARRAYFRASGMFLSTPGAPLIKRAIMLKQLGRSLPHKPSRSTAKPPSHQLPPPWLARHGQAERCCDKRPLTSSLCCYMPS